MADHKQMASQEPAPKFPYFHCDSYDVNATLPKVKKTEPLLVFCFDLLLVWHFGNFNSCSISIQLSTHIDSKYL